MSKTISKSTLKSWLSNYCCQTIQITSAKFAAIFPIYFFFLILSLKLFINFTKSCNKKVITIREKRIKKGFLHLPLQFLLVLHFDIFLHNLPILLTKTSFFFSIKASVDAVQNVNDHYESWKESESHVGRFIKRT